jgi:ADP-heptose:LPS heptosyltransferase
MKATLKALEIRFRKFVIEVLAAYVKRGTPLPADFDFQHAKFLFVRQDRIGDVLVSTPLFHLLHERYPTAAIDVLLSKNNHFVLTNDHVVRKRWVYQKHVVKDWQLLQAIRNERYDFVIDLMDNPSATSTILALLAGGSWNVGLEKENDYVYDIVVPLLSRKETHIVERLAELLRVFRLEVDARRLKLRYYTSDAAEEFASTFWVEQRLNENFVIGLNLSAGSDVRFWGVLNFRKLVVELQRHYAETPIILLFHPTHRRRAEDIQRGFRNVLLSPETHSFDHFAALIKRLGFLVTPDTSVVHLASAFRIPSVVMYVQSNKSLRIWEPYNTPCETLVTDVDDLATIPADTVFDAVHRLLPKALDHAQHSVLVSR